ncbi:DUF6191 domain-containing protein [Streptomyces sp. NPDC096057]|uniref:DUF6191 domain-containing protein n=1 Tax=Streptomyces sp. NPDC096057 TaxID=3155543 RepID=UPI0033240C94
MFNMFEELFSPGRKHTQDEANRLEMTRVDVADGDPGRGPIDLESGRVVVRLPEPEPEPEPEAEPAVEPEAEPAAETESAAEPEAVAGPRSEPAADPES